MKPGELSKDCGLLGGLVLVLIGLHIVTTHTIL